MLEQTATWSDVLRVVDLMTQVSCIYCGQKVSAAKNQVGEKICCPACGHAVTVHPKRPLRTAPLKRKQLTYWQGKSDDEIVDRLLFKTLSEEDQFRRTVKKICRPLLPRYDDLTLFALSVAFVLLFFLNASLRAGLVETLTFKERAAGPLVIPLAIAALGIVFSLFNVFFERKKREFEKWAMLAFAVMVTASTGIYTASLMLEKGRSLLLIFPLWNLFNALLLIFLFRMGLLGTECIIDRKASSSQILVTVISTAFLLLLCQYAFKLHWAITYSIAVGYTMSLHGAVQDMFGKHASTR